VGDGGSEASGAERRRFPRQVAYATARLPMSVDADVIDISMTGALISCDCPLRVGDRAEIQTVLAGQPFGARVSVIRIATDCRDAAGKTCAGVMFVGTGEGSLAILRRFLDQSL
jgi:hypothetical protein